MESAAQPSTDKWTEKLHLANEQRSSSARTEQSDHLARDILSQAKIKKTKVPPKEQYAIVIKEPHLDIHYMELMQSLNELSKEYGVKFELISNNRVMFV